MPNQTVVMDPNRTAAELDFWRGWMQRPDYIQIRKQDYEDKTKFFRPEIDECLAANKLGLDLGCGPESVFEHAPVVEPYRRVIPVDALAGQYAPSPLLNTTKLMYKPVPMNAEALDMPNECIDWVFCINMIDHTPDHSKALKEIHRVLVPGGYFFFEVHFDPSLFAPHYSLWNEETVQREVDTLFTKQRDFKDWHPEWNKYLYWGLYKK